MPFVIVKENGKYASARGWRARYSEGTDDLQKARVFTRKVDAINGGGSQETVKEVKLALVEEPA